MPVLGPEWRKSTRSSGSGSCVEVRLIDGRVDVRDTKQNGRGPVLGFLPGEWRAFVDGVRAGEFDR